MKRTEHNEEQWLFPFIEYCCESADEKLPLIIQLHGAGERGHGKEELELVEVHGFSEHIKNFDYECRIVMPQCPKESFWAAKVESLLNFIEQLKANYDIDDDRIYLTGLSMGGYGTWFTAMAKPDLFAAIAPVCGGGMAWNAETLRMPIWVFHGIEDNLVSVRQSDEMVEKLILFNKNVTYSRLEGVGHEAWEYAYNRELMNWLLEKKRQSA